MKILIGGRGTGVSTDLIDMAKKLNIPIITNHTVTEKKYEGVTAINVRRQEPFDIETDKIIVDDLESLLINLLSDKGIHVGKIVAAGTTVEGTTFEF